MNILVVDDEKSVRLALADELEEMGYQVQTAASGEAAIELLKKHPIDLVICDLVMGNVSGADVLDFIQQEQPTTQFILITANATIESAIQTLKKGALDYLIKPFSMEHLHHIIHNTTETIRLRRENESLKKQLSQQYQFDNIVGDSKPMRQVFELLHVVSQSDISVLITGDTGTGKGLIAQTIHYNSPRANKPFVTISCAALSRELLESELFGHEKGSFTGAIKQKKGRFELADGGTLFLDEVDDIPLETQVKLLQVIETGMFERVGGESTLKVDVRIIAASKKDLRAAIEAGTFRRDLFYRLNVMPIYLPSLKERKEDIPLLVNYFLNKYNPDHSMVLAPEVMDYFLAYDWDGNIRELEHVIERLVLLSKDGYIDKCYLPANIREFSEKSAQYQWGNQPLPEYLYQVEHDILVEASHRTGGSKTRMAELLGIPLPTLKSKLAKFNIR